jgi:hypothetical protein
MTGGGGDVGVRAGGGDAVGGAVMAEGGVAKVGVGGGLPMAEGEANGGAVVVKGGE